MMFFETLLALFSVSSAVRIFSCLIHLNVSDAPCFAFASRMLCSVVTSVELLCIALLCFFFIVVEGPCGTEQALQGMSQEQKLAFADYCSVRFPCQVR